MGAGVRTNSVQDKLYRIYDRMITCPTTTAATTSSSATTAVPQKSECNVPVGAKLSSTDHFLDRGIGRTKSTSRTVVAAAATKQACGKACLADSTCVAFGFSATARYDHVRCELST